MSGAASLPSSSSSSTTKRLGGKVALVTGGASGIGEAITRLFKDHGAKVCIADIQDEAGQKLRDALGGGGDDDAIMFVYCDVTVEDDVSAAVDAAVQRFGALDVMVDNAGITGSKVTDIRDVDFAEVRKVFDINVHGVFMGMKHAACVMIPRKRGSIVSLASVATVVVGMGPHAYAACKHAVAGLTKSVAAELGRVRRRRGQRLPGLRRRRGQSEGCRPDARGRCRGGALYLASDEAKYVSALNLVVDGGVTSVNHDMKQFED